jgi:hypothetical protein
MSDRGQRNALPLPVSVPETIRQPVRVAVDFAGPKVRPLAFLWSGRKYVIKKVNLQYKRPHGQRWQWCFAVSDETNSYVLVYDPEELTWILEEVYEQ